MSGPARGAAVLANRLWRASQLAVASSGAGPLTRSLDSQWRCFSSLPPHTILGMPALSPTMTAGNIAAWHVKEGDEVSAGTVLADIETDKATLAFENQDDGFIAKLLLPAGAKDVAVGAPVAVIVEEADQIAAFAGYTVAAGGGGSSTASAAAAAPAAAPAAAAAAAPAARSGGAVNFRLGPAARKALQEAGLSPADIPNPSGPNGIVTKQDVLEAVAAGVKPSGQAAAAVAAASQQQAAAAAPPPPPQQQQAKAAAPAAAAAPQPPPQQQQPAPRRGAGGPRVSYTDVPNSQVRGIIAKRLLESKQTAPSLYVSADAPLDGVQALRKQLAAQGIKISVNDCIVRAVALALRDVPEANAAWDPASGQAVPQPSVDVAVAVATEGGLITPIVRDAANKSLAQISAEVRDLAARARANKLAPHEFQGGSFTISNLGMYGLSNFSAIINPPQAAILAVGGAHETVSLAAGAPAAAAALTATLSADHRVFDGELAAKFLAAFSGYMAQPVSMVV